LTPANPAAVRPANIAAPIPNAGESIKMFLSGREVAFFGGCFDMAHWDNKF